MRRDSTGFLKLSEEAGLLGGRARFLGWATDSDTITQAIRALDKAKDLLFRAAIEAQPKAENLPLFDRPRSEAEAESKAAVSNGNVVEDVTLWTPGRKLFACNKCNRVRARDVPVCPACECPEYSLRVVAPEGGIVPDEEARDELLAPPKRKPKKGPKPVDFDEDPTGEIAAHLNANGWRSLPIARLDLPESTKKTLAEDFANLGDLSDAFEQYEREAEGDDSFINRNLAKARRQVLEAIAKFKDTPKAPMNWRDSPSDALGDEFADGLFDSEIETLGEAWDLLESGALVQSLEWTVADAKALEIALVKLRAEAGDPAPNTAPIEEKAPARPGRFLVKAARGNPLYILEADSLERATAYVRDQHPDDSQTIEPIDAGGFPAKSPAWLATRGIPAHWQPGVDLGSKPKKSSRKRKEAAVAR